MAKYLWLLAATLVTFAAQWANIAVLGNKYDRLTIYLLLGAVGALVYLGIKHRTRKAKANDL